MCTFDIQYTWTTTANGWFIYVCAGRSLWGRSTEYFTLARRGRREVKLGSSSSFVSRQPKPDCSATRGLTGLRQFIKDLIMPVSQSTMYHTD